MRKNITFRSNYAVSEVVGGILLIMIAVITFTVLQHYLIPDEPKIEDNIKLEGFVNSTGAPVIKHVGGQSITSYLLLINDIYGNRIFANECKNLNSPWKIGECIYPLEGIDFPPLINITDGVEIIIISYGEKNLQQEVFRGVLSGSFDGRGGFPLLVSSLRTDTPNEDLICYSYPIIPDINATTYIYKWLINGQTIADLIMPFNTQNQATTKDYSGYNNHATVVGATWTNQAKMGGAYYFKSSDYITMPLPNVFSDISNKDFTISLWLKSEGVFLDHAVALLASKDTQNFVRIFSYQSGIHIGVCANGIKDAVRTQDLSSDEWYHIVAVWSASRRSIIIYCNGEPYTSEGYTNYASGLQANSLDLGSGTASSKFWSGYIDELEIYDRALSEEQIYQLYLSSKDGDYDRRIIVSKETKIGDSWQCIVTPNDGLIDGTIVESNILQIKSYTGGD